MTGSDVVQGGLSRAIAEFAVQKRTPLFVCALMLLALAYCFTPAPSYHLAIEDLFLPSDPDLQSYLLSKKIFGADDLVVVAYPDAEAETAQGLERCARWAQRLRQVNGVAEVVCLAEPPFDVVFRSDAVWANDARKLAQGYAWTTSGKTAVALCKLEPRDPAGPERRRTIGDLRAITLQASAQGVLAGEPAMLVDGVMFVEGDGNRLQVSAALLMGLVLFASFRSVRWLLLPFILVVWTVYVSRFSAACLGLEMSMVSSMIGSMITVIVVGATTHLPIRFRHARRIFINRDHALIDVLSAIGPAVLWSMITDMCGFGSLLVVDVGPVRDYGVMLAISSLLVLPAIYLLAPTIILAGSLDTEPGTPGGEARLHQFLRWIVLQMPKRRLAPLLLALFFAGAGIAGLSRVKVETSFLANFRSDTNIARSYRYLEDEFGGVGVWYIVGPAPRPLTPSFVNQLEGAAKNIRKEADLTPGHGLTKSLSAADFFHIARASPLKSVLQWMSPEQVLDLARSQHASLLDGLIREDPATGKRWYRIVLRAKESIDAQARAATVHAVRKAVNETMPEATVTGFYVLLGRLVENLLRGQTMSAIAALALIAVALRLAVGSVRFALLGLVPNLLPLILVCGSLSWLGLKLNMGAVMIAAVSLGMTVDASLHYLTDYQRRRSQGETPLQAILGLQESVGIAIFYSTFALVLGFWSLSVSQFIPTVYFGVLSGLALLGGLLGNLVFLPWLLLHLGGEKSPSPTL